MIDASIVLYSQAFFFGAVMGIFFFGGLSRTIAAVLERKGRSAMAMLSFPLRLFVAATVFAGLAHFGGLPAVLAALAGFSCVQIIFMAKAGQKTGNGR